MLDWLGYATGLPVLARQHLHIQLMLEALVEPVLSCGNDAGSDVPDELDKEEVVVEQIHDKFSQIFFEAILVRISLISGETVLMCNDFLLW